MRRSYKFLLRPTSQQVAALEACLEDTRQLYNAALEERREAWRMGGTGSRSTAGRPTQGHPRGRPGAVRALGVQCEQAAIRRLDRAFQAFYRRVKAGEKPGYPRFKGRGWWDSIEWPSRQWLQVGFGPASHGHPRLPDGHRPRPRAPAPGVKGRIKTITVKREGGRWYVVLSCDDVPAEPLRRRVRSSASTWASRRS